MQGPCKEEVSDRNEKEWRNKQLTWRQHTTRKGGGIRKMKAGATSHPSCQMAQKTGGGRVFSSGGRVRNADHRSEESSIQGASLPGACLVKRGICQVEGVANVF